MARSCEEVSLAVFVWSLVICGAMTVVYCEWIPWKLFSSPLGWIPIASFTFLVVMLCRSYYLAMTITSYAPLDYIPPDVSPEELQHAKEEALKPNPPKSRKGDAQEMRKKVRYCSRCNAFKPPRAHHCRDCGRCTLKMDHHCPWVGNCVGYYNHKAFVLFISYAVLALGFAVVSHVIAIIDVVQTEGDMSNPVKYSIGRFLCMILGTAFMAPFMLGLVPLVISQLMTCWSNETTIEGMSNSYSFNGRKAVNMYDLGCRSNLRQMFGDSAFRWLCPTIPVRSPDAGCSYPLAPKTTEEVQPT